MSKTFYKKGGNGAMRALGALFALLIVGVIGTGVVAYTVQGAEFLRFWEKPTSAATVTECELEHLAGHTCPACGLEHVEVFAVGELLEAVEDGNFEWTEYPTDNWVKITATEQEGYGHHELIWWGENGQQGVRITGHDSWRVEFLAEYEGGSPSKTVNLWESCADYAIDEGEFDDETGEWITEPVFHYTWDGMAFYLRAGEIVFVQDGVLLYSVKFPAIEIDGIGEVSGGIAFERYAVV